MEIQQLISFTETVQQESFSQAAKKLGYSQAAITIQIQKLETELNTRLFDRMNKRIRLTQTGKEFYPYALQILNDIEAAKNFLQDEKEIQGNLNIGTTDSLCASIFPPLLESFHKVYPKIKINIITESIPELHEMLQKNDIDFAYLIDQKWSSQKWVHILDMEESVNFICSKNYAKKLKKPYTFSSLLKEPFILTEKDVSYRQILDRFDLTIDPILETKNTDLIVQLVLKDMGITFLPAFICENKPELEILPVQDFDVQVHRQIIVHKNKWISAEMKAFFAFLLQKI